jgi:hypothetical protein
MHSLELLYKLSEDPDSFWILYDLYLENNWASCESHALPVYISHPPGYMFGQLRSWQVFSSFSHINGWGGTTAGLYIAISI